MRGVNNIHRTVGIRPCCSDSPRRMLSLLISHRSVHSIRRIAPQWTHPRRCVLSPSQQQRHSSRSPEGTSTPLLPIPTAQQPMTLWERTKSFSNGVYRLYQDYLLYSNIHAAAQTALHTSHHPWSRRHSSGAPIIPWRQQAQQRQFLAGFYTVAPVVTLFLLPVVGYLPMLLSVALPRQLLSRHFYNDYEIYHYNQLADRQRRLYYSRVPVYWPQDILVERSTGSDVVADLCAVYQTYFQGDAEPKNVTVSKTTLALADLDRYPRDYLLALSLSSGLYPTLPGPLQDWCAARCTPTWYLRQFLRQRARTIARDDAVLLHEEHRVASQSQPTDGPSFVHAMTTVELMDACLLRGLPILHVSREEMCTSLRQHLRIMAAVRTPVVAEFSPHVPLHDTADVDVLERIGLFALHLPILRQQLESQSSSA